MKVIEVNEIAKLGYLTIEKEGEVIYSPACKMISAFDPNNEDTVRTYAELIVATFDCFVSSLPEDKQTEVEKQILKILNEEVHERHLRIEHFPTHI